MIVACSWVQKDHFLPPGVDYTTGLSHNPFIHSARSKTEMITP